MSRIPPNHSEDTQGYIAGLSAERLSYPEPYLYKLLLDAQKVEDTAERRREFKRLLVGRQVEEGIAPPQVDQKQLTDFMNPDDAALKVERSLDLVRLLERHFEETRDFAQSQRLAVLELFHQEAPLRQAETDRAYFENAELVRADLESLAIAASKKAGRTILPEDLNLGRYISASFALTTGESMIGSTYLSRAAKALGEANNEKEAQAMRKKIVIILKQTAGFEVADYPPTDKAYFQDSDKVRADFESMASAVSAATGKTIQPEDLNLGRSMDISFTLTTGESITGKTYLRRATIAMDRAKDSKEARKVRKEILATLKQTAGFEITEYPPTDETYFQNAELVRADLMAFAEQLGEGKASLDLSTGNIPSLSITCQNGQEMRGNTYLKTAAKALGFAKDSREAGSKLAKTLKHLLKTAALELFDTSYFQNPENVKADLTACAKQLGQDKTPLDLNTRNIRSLPITCQNGQVMKGNTYLKTAAKALGFAEGDREATAKLAQTLEHLLKTAGFELFDKDYFQNSENVRNDLIAFTSQLGEDKTPLDLSTKNISALSIICQNGQVMKGQAYLNTAARALGFAKGSREAQSKQARILKYLLRTAGFEIPEYTPLDEAYFRDPNKVKADLFAFASQLGEAKTPFELGPGNIASLSITCQNGQPIKGCIYLYSAAKALGFAKNNKEASRIQSQILRHLLKVAGFDIFDKDYFQNPDKVKADLTAFASQLGEDKSHFDLSTYNMIALYITCHNRQEINGDRYLRMAAKALFFFKNAREADCKRAQTLRKLKQIAGFTPE